MKLLSAPKKLLPLRTENQDQESLRDNSVVKRLSGSMLVTKFKIRGSRFVYIIIAAIGNGNSSAHEKQISSMQWAVYSAHPHFRVVIAMAIKPGGSQQCAVSKKSFTMNDAR
jgi:hypothetical protein